jgi:hypothetical protein
MEFLTFISVCKSVPSLTFLVFFNVFELCVEFMLYDTHIEFSKGKFFWLMCIALLLTSMQKRATRLKKTKTYFIYICLSIPFCIRFMSGRHHFVKKGENRCTLILVHTCKTNTSREILKQILVGCTVPIFSSKNTYVYSFSNPQTLPLDTGNNHMFWENRLEYV